MATWNSGAKWSSNTLWGPASGPDPFATRQRNTQPNNNTNMSRKPFFPETLSERPGWFDTLAAQLPLANAILKMDATTMAARVEDAKYCSYSCGEWLNWVRDCGTQATAAIEQLYNGTGEDDFLMPVFTPPALPVGVTAVPPGALRRILDFVAQIKRQPGYTEVIGYQLGIIGEEIADEHPVPEFNLSQERGDGCQCVRVRFYKYGHKGVVIFSKRGNGTWEMLGIDLASPYMDERPLLVAGQPELREYRLQWYDNDGPNGEFSPVQTITVNP
jgi:hypothetical protein